MQHYGYRMFKPAILGWLRNRKLLDLEWYDGDTLAMHRSSTAGAIQGYFEALATRPVIMVGPHRLQKLKSRGLVDYRAYIETPKRDAFVVLPQVQKDILKAYSQLTPPVVISISCGLPAGILAYRLFQEIGTEAFIFDAGSVYDAYCGYATRKYMTRLHRNWKEGKGHAPERIRAGLEESAARSDPAVREDGSGREGDS